MMSSTQGEGTIPDQDYTGERTILAEIRIEQDKLRSKLRLDQGAECLQDNLSWLYIDLTLSTSERSTSRTRSKSRPSYFKPPKIHLYEKITTAIRTMNPFMSQNIATRTVVAPVHVAEMWIVRSPSVQYPQLSGLISLLHKLYTFPDRKPICMSYLSLRLPLPL